MWSRSPEGGSQFSGPGKNQGPDPQAEPGNGYDYNPTGRGHEEVNMFACLVCHSSYSRPHGVWGAEGRGDDGICGHRDRTWGPVVPGWSPSPSTGRRWPLTLVQRGLGGPPAKAQGLQQKRHRLHVFWEQTEDWTAEIRNVRELNH